MRTDFLYFKGVVEIAIKTGDRDYAGTDVPMHMKICDQDTCLPIIDARYNGVRMRKAIGQASAFLGQFSANYKYIYL